MFSVFFFFKQKTAYEMRISDWSSDVCSSDLDVAANVSGIDPAGARALDDWFASINLGYGDRVTVDDPVSYGAAERRAAVAQAVGRYGFLLDGTAPEIGRATLRERGGQSV